MSKDSRKMKEELRIETSREAEERALRAHFCVPVSCPYDFNWRKLLCLLSRSGAGIAQFLLLLSGDEGLNPSPVQETKVAETLSSILEIYGQA